MGSIPWLGRYPGGGNGYPLQHSCLGNPMDRGALWAAVQSVQFSHSVVCDSATPWTAARQASLSITNSRSLPKLVYISDAIQSSHPLLSPSLPAFNLSQHQGLFQWISSSHQVAKVLEFQLQHQSFQWIFTLGYPLGFTGLISLQTKGLSKVFSNTTVQKHQFFCA